MVPLTENRTESRTEKLAAPSAERTEAAMRVGPEVFTSTLEITTAGGAVAETYRCLFATTVAGGVRNRCGSKPVVRVVLATGELFCCAHHYQGNEDALRKVALEVHDHRGSLG